MQHERCSLFTAFSNGSDDVGEIGLALGYGFPCGNAELVCIGAGVEQRDQGWVARVGGLNPGFPDG